MSFKRVGDDHCALRRQKKQRVAELFSADIPADEVTRTRSGKYTCQVCPHNPVLDTMPMLSIHRQGKRHLANAALKVEKEHNLKELLQKRKQELYLKEASNNTTNKGTESIKTTDSSEAAPLLAKTRQLAESFIRSTQESQKRTGKNVKVAHHPRYTNELSRKGKKPFFQSRLELKLDKRVFGKKSSPASVISLVETSENGKYCGGVPQGAIAQPSTLANSSTPVFCAATKNGFYTADEKVTKLNGNFGGGVPQGSMDISSTSNSEKPSLVANFLTVNSATIEGSLKSNKEDVCGRLNIQEQKVYLKMKMAGWILDLNGKWIKDENVEFDSDEEPPDLA